MNVIRHVLTPIVVVVLVVFFGRPLPVKDDGETNAQGKNRRGLMRLNDAAAHLGVAD